MFDLSLAEIGLIVVAAVVFIGPKDLPVVIRALSKGMTQLKEFAHELKLAFEDMAKEPLTSIQDEMEGDMHFIRDQEGVLRETYDLKDVLPPQTPQKKESRHEG